MSRTVYAVKTKGGYLGNRRYNYKDGTHRLEGVPFESARLYPRLHDAMEAAGYIRGATVVTARVDPEPKQVEAIND